MSARNNILKGALQIESSNAFNSAVRNKYSLDLQNANEIVERCEFNNDGTGIDAVCIKVRRYTASAGASTIYNLPASPGAKVSGFLSWRICYTNGTDAEMGILAAGRCPLTFDADSTVNPPAWSAVQAVATATGFNYLGGAVEPFVTSTSSGGAGGTDLVTNATLSTAGVFTISHASAGAGVAEFDIIMSNDPST